MDFIIKRVPFQAVNKSPSAPGWEQRGWGWRGHKEGKEAKKNPFHPFRVDMEELPLFSGKQMHRATFEHFWKKPLESSLNFHYFYSEFKSNHGFLNSPGQKEIFSLQQKEICSHMGCPQWSLQSSLCLPYVEGQG